MSGGFVSYYGRAHASESVFPYLEGTLVKISHATTRRRRILSGVISASLLAGGLAFGVAPAAHAAGTAEAGVGFGSLNGEAPVFPGSNDGWLGSIYIPGVGYTYCVNVALGTGYNNDPVEQTSYNRTFTSDSGWSAVGGRTYTADLTPREMFEVSYIIGEYGQLDAPRSGYSLDQAEWAAAVELSVWDRATPSMSTGIGTMSPSDLYAMRAGSSEAAVRAKLAIINADVAGQVPSSSTGASGTLDVEMQNYRDGSLVINLAGAPSASVVLTLSGAVFSATGSNTMTVEATDGLRIPITGLYEQPKDTSGVTYNIHATGTATVAGSGYGENARVLSSSGQDTITTGSAPPTTFDLTAASEDPIILFDAVVTTEAPVFIGEGETFADTLFATIGNPNDPAANPWPRWSDGSSYDVEARGTLYGPFLALPDQSATAPSWAPIVATDIPVTLSGEGTYTADAQIGALEPGFYTWQWEIDAADQNIFTKAVMPTDYHFVDDFAQRAESTISSSKIVAASQVVQDEVAVTDKVSDSITVGSQGGWIQEDGARVPVVFDGTAYFVPGDVAPELSDTVPAGTEVLGTTQIPVTAPGTYTSEELDAPVNRQGFVVWVWEIKESSQPAEYRGYVKDWADQFGIPAETTRVLMPVVATQAQTDVPVGDPIWDIAVVSGRVPTSGMNLYFELYEAKKDASGEWVCEAGDNLLWTSSSQTVTAEGTYQSPNAPAQPEGTYHWVEVITTPGGEEISRGKCGVPTETSVVTAPEVKTNAQPGANLGGELFDVATVTGAIAEDGYDLTFAAYKVPVVKDETTGEWATDYPEGFKPSEEEGANNLEWVCEADPVFETSEPILVKEEGDFTSESFTPEEFGKYLWVETLTWNGENGESIEIHRGECGIAEESGVILDVTTQAQTDNSDQTVGKGEAAWDVALLNGYVPEGATVEIRAYQPETNTPVAEACVAENEVFTWTSEPLLGGMAENLEVKSDKFAPKNLEAASTLYFVETTKDALGRTVSEGECGEPSETLTVDGNGVIAWTGGDSAPALWVGGVTLMALIAGAGVYMIRRRETV